MSVGAETSYIADVMHEARWCLRALPLRMLREVWWWMVLGEPR